MADSEKDEFGKRKIYRSSRDPKRAKSWLLGMGDWKSRIYDWDGEITARIGEDGFLILNVKNYKRYYDDNGIYRVGSKDGRGRKPVLAKPIEYDSQGNPSPIVTERTQSTLRRRGYMGTPADWKNVEITLYAKVNDVGDEAGEKVGEPTDQPYVKQLALVARGGPRHSNTPLFGDPCQGCAYYAVMNVDGNPVVTKELFHDNGYCAEKDGITYNKKYKDEETGEEKVRRIKPLHSHFQGDDSIPSRWIGMKGIFYTNDKGNPVIELWIDENNEDHWVKSIDIEDTLDVTISNFDTDSNGWFLERPEYPPGTPPIFRRNQCGGEANERITWGGPAVKFRWDYITDVDIKWASVREIVPPEMSLRNLLKATGISFTADIRSVVEDYDLVTPISVRDLAERLL